MLWRDMRYINNLSDLAHFRRNRSLRHYMDNIKLLIDPSSTPCESLNEVPVVALVTSSPLHQENRDAIRSTWAKHLPTFFVVGLNGETDEQLAVIYLEAKQNGDLIVYDFQDHYQNLTLKSALMLRWTAGRCPQAGYMLKTDDDVMVNPWTLLRVVKENNHAMLLGYQFNQSEILRDVDNKWFLPRWLFQDDMVEQYLSGSAYLIKGEYTKRILDAATEVPLINIEDIYFTFMVAQKKLGLNLTHDPRIYPYRPWWSVACSYWCLASVHGLRPQDLTQAWPSIVQLEREFKYDENVCGFYKSYFL